MNNPCPHCGKQDCYRHCYEAVDGQHVADPATAHCPQQSPFTDFVVDYNCKHCGMSGSTTVDPNDIHWE